MAKPVTVKELTPDVEISADEAAAVGRQIADLETARMAKAAREETARRTSAGQINRLKCIDPHVGMLATYTPTGWMALTPSMCTLNEKCCFDGAEAIGFKQGWDSIPEDLKWRNGTMREYALQQLADHKALRHATGGISHVRTAEEAVAARAERTIPEGFIENPRL